MADRPLPAVGPEGEPCRRCAAPLAGDQRYCLDCGTRRGTGDALDFASLFGRRAPAPTPAVAGGPPGFADALGRRLERVPLPVPPQFATVMVLAVLVSGMLLGSLATDSTLALGGRVVNIVLPGTPVAPTALPPSLATNPAADEEPLPEVSADDGGDDAPADAEPIPEEPIAEAPIAEEPIAEEPVADDPPADDPPAEQAPARDDGLPEIKHVFVISLTGHDFDQTFGPASPAPYLARTLTARGTLLTQHHAVARGPLANGIGLISGQGPTPEHEQGCPVKTDIAPGTVGPDDQEQGRGCVFSVQTATLPNQLLQQGLTYKAYVEGAGGCEPEKATARNPFLFFRALTESADCKDAIVGLDALERDLETSATTPNLAYIVPDACHDGTDAPCREGAPAGLAAADAFLADLVPRLLRARVYDDSLVVILPDGAPAPEPLGCCEPPAFANTPSKPGGGRVGALLLSPYVRRGAVVGDPTNHFSLLRSVQELFQLEGLGYAKRPGVKTLGALKVFRKAR